MNEDERSAPGDKDFVKTLKIARSELYFFIYMHAVVLASLDYPGKSRPGKFYATNARSQCQKFKVTFSRDIIHR